MSCLCAQLTLREYYAAVVSMHAPFLRGWCFVHPAGGTSTAALVNFAHTADARSGLELKRAQFLPSFARLDELLLSIAQWGVNVVTRRPPPLAASVPIEVCVKHLLVITTPHKSALHQHPQSLEGCCQISLSLSLADV